MARRIESIRDAAAGRYAHARLVLDSTRMIARLVGFLAGAPAALGVLVGLYLAFTGSGTSWAAGIALAGTAGLLLVSTLLGVLLLLANVEHTSAGIDSAISSAVMEYIEIERWSRDADLETAATGTARARDGAARTDRLSVRGPEQGDGDGAPASHLDRPLAGEPLNAREADVLRLLGEGKSVSESASSLYIPQALGEAALASAIRKLAAKDANDAVARARHLGLIRSP